MKFPTFGHFSSKIREPNTWEPKIKDTKTRESKTRKSAKNQRIVKDKRFAPAADEIEGPGGVVDFGADVCVQELLHRKRAAPASRQKLTSDNFQDRQLSRSIQD